MDTPAQPPTRGPHGAWPIKRPVTQQRYAARRLGAAAVVALVVFGAVKGVGSLTEQRASGNEPPNSLNTAGSSTSGTSSPVASSPVAVGSPTTSVTTTPTTTEPEGTGPPTQDDPAELLIVGDSDAGTFGPYLERVVDEWGVVDVELDYIASTGLARPEAHNWPRHLRESVAASDPDIVVVTFGGNDAQGLTEACADDAMECLDSGGPTDVVVGMVSDDNEEEWTDEYARRVSEVMDILTADPDRVVVWVGIPNAADAAFTELLRVQDRAVRQALEAYPTARFVNTWSIFDGVNGGIAELVVDPRDGVAKPVRAGDGFHLNEDGAEILAVAVSREVEDVLAAMGADV